MQKRNLPSRTNSRASPDEGSNNSTLGSAGFVSGFTAVENAGNKVKAATDNIKNRIISSDFPSFLMTSYFVKVFLFETNGLNWAHPISVEVHGRQATILANEK
jgi:hypothetical protein